MKKIISILKSNRFNLITFISIFILLFAALLSYFLIDRRFESLASSYNSNFDNFTGANLLKSLGKVYVPLWLFFIWGYAKKNLQIVMTASLSLLIAFAITGPLKLITRRERPRETYMEVTYTPQGEVITSNSDNQSFPSSDTAMVFAGAVIVTPFLSVFSLSWLYVLATAVGILRILAFAHYPSDVLTGAAIGIFSGWNAIDISRRWISQNKFYLKEKWTQIVPLVTVIIPLLTFFTGGTENLLTFFYSSAALAGSVYLTNKIPIHIISKSQNNTGAN